MNCMHCGAVLPVRAERCEYCGAATPYAKANLEEKLRQEKKDSLKSMKRVSGGMLLFLYFFSLGFYSCVWYILRSKSLNRLAPNKIRLPLWAACLYMFFIVSWFFLPQDFVRFGLGLSAEAIDNYFTLALLLSFVLSLWLAFRVRSILQIYASQYLEKSVVVLSIASSGLMMILFGALYLQFQINKMISMELLNPDL